MEKYSNEEVRDILAKFGKEYTTTENGALTPLTTGSKIVDQFGKVASFRGRKFDDVFKDMEEIWSENSDLSLKFIFYLRMISRVTVLPNGEETDKVQKGQGCKDEAFKRLLWLLAFHEDIFYSNIYLLPIVGTWKDLWVLMVMAFNEGVPLNRQVLYALMATAMKSTSQIDLIKKFMPRIKTKSNVKTALATTLNSFAKEFAKFLGFTPRQYNKFKSTGTAHEFQRLICGRKFDELNFNRIPGIALGKLVQKDFLSRHDIEDKYFVWLENQDTVKFNGYPYDLLIRMKNAIKGSSYYLLNQQNSRFSAYGGYDLWNEVSPILKRTTDLQFDHLIATAQRDGKFSENVLCALDTSGSMQNGANKNIAPLDICLSLGMYFSTLNQGHFHKKVVAFDSTSNMIQLNGSFCDMLRQLPKDAMGSTNFISVINLLINYKNKHPEVSIEEYPTTLLVVSDMQFNPTRSDRTNFETSKALLANAFPKEYVDKIKFIWWNVNGIHEGVPATLEDGGCYLFSGFDGTVVNLLLGNEEKGKPTPSEPKSMIEIVTEALNQEVLSYIH